MHLNFVLCNPTTFQAKLIISFFLVHQLLFILLFELKNVILELMLITFACDIKLDL
jgi:hypothetical protein